jgi:hypothetical protein
VRVEPRLSFSFPPPLSCRPDPGSKTATKVSVAIPAIGLTLLWRVERPLHQNNRTLYPTRRCSAELRFEPRLSFSFPRPLSPPLQGTEMNVLL